MIFTESRFFLFFLVAFAVHWVLRTNATRKAWLLAASCVFYAAWDWRFLGLLALSTLVDYAAGLALGAAQGQRARRVLVGVSLVVNLGFLLWFKYFDFFVEAGVGLFHLFGLEADAEPYRLGLILPVGISFYTFQTLSYTLDVYRRKLAPVRSLSDFALFVTFFPQLVAGPIVRASEFLPQLAETRRFRSIEFRACLTLFFFGFLKKAVVADNLAPVTDQVFADPLAHDTLSNWIGVLMWHIQEYMDFSGYTDMAIATAGLLGYRLPENFNFPFFAHNIAEFWRRWHITLSSWFRDYLYVVIGGSKGTLWRGIASGCLTMLLVGLWHGAGWQHALFGILMSLAILTSRLWGEYVPERSTLRRTVHLAGPLIVNLFLFVNWIAFRAESWEACRAQYRIFFLLEPGGTRAVDPRWLLAFAAFVLIQCTLYYRWLPRLVPFLRRPINGYLWATSMGVATALALLFMASDYQPFVYFHF